MENRTKKQIACCLAAMAVLFFTQTAPAVERQKVQRMAFVMGTTLQVETEGWDKQQLSMSAQAALDEVIFWENLLSNYNPESELSWINKALKKRRKVVVSKPMVRYLENSLYWARQTQGAFDPSVEVLTELWGLRERQLDQIPTPEDIEYSLMRVGFRNFSLRKDTLIAQKTEFAFDSGGFGKGFALDQAMDKAKAFAVDKITFNFGGQILRFSVQVETQTVVLRSGEGNLATRQKLIVNYPQPVFSIATSDNSQRYVTVGKEQEGEKVVVGHILNPFNGKPVKSRVQKVTVIAPQAAQADAFSTAVFVMAENKSWKEIETWLEEFPGSAAQVRMLDAEGKLQIYSTNLWNQWMQPL